MQKITPFLWFDNQAEEAINFYVSLLQNSRMINVTRYGDEDGQPGPIMLATFQLDGQEFMALNGGPNHKFSEAVSLFVDCETQAEVDELWAKFTEGGEEGPCGWLKDKYGLSWQIVPSALGQLMNDTDPVRAQRVMNAMLQMKKIDITMLQQAYDQP